MTLDTLPTILEHFLNLTPGTTYIYIENERD